jgi:hypothetical protein
MGLVLKKTVTYALFCLLLAWFTAFPLLAEEEKGKDHESDGKALFHLGQREFDAGGRSVFKQPDKSDFFSQQVVDEKIESYWIFQ